MGSEALYLATGLALVFLLLSTTPTALYDLVEAWFKTLAADLRLAAPQLLNDSNAGPDVTTRDSKTAEAAEAVYSRSVIPDSTERLTGRLPRSSRMFFCPTTLMCAEMARGSRAGRLLGFFGEQLRQHDFDLGRVNAQHFLLQSLRLPATNPLFGGKSASQA